MTNAELKTRVALNLSNMEVTHPHYTEIQDAVNDAKRDLVKMVAKMSIDNLNLFPELLARVRAITVADDSTLNLPVSNMLIPLRMHSWQQATAPDDDRDRTWPMRYVDPEVWEYLQKDTTIVGWPRLWTRIGNDAKLWPTPTADYVTYVRMYYIIKEDDFTTEAQEPTLDSQWHRALTDLATYYVLVGMQQAEKAAFFLTACKLKITDVLSINALTERAQSHIAPSADAVDMGLADTYWGGM